MTEVPLRQLGMTLGAIGVRASIILVSGLVALGFADISRAQTLPPPTAWPAAGSAVRSTAAQETVLVRIDGFRDLIWRPADNYFLSPGPVRIELKSLARGETMVLTADDAEGRPDGDIAVKGRLRLVRQGSVLTGSQLTLNPVTETGSIVAAEALVGRIRVRGDRITMSPDHGLVATGASFTTCGDAAPHYRISARKLRLAETGMVSAEGVTLWIRNRPILAIPWLQKNFRQKVESPFPLPAYSKETGPVFRLRNDTMSSPTSALTYELVAALRKAPYGNVTLERDLGHPAPDAAPPATRKAAWREPRLGALEMHPTFARPDREPTEESDRTVAYATLGVLDYVGNRKRTDLRLNRLPEIGVGRFRPGERSKRGRSGFGYHWDVSAGRFREKPTEVESNRAALQVGIASPQLEVLPGLSLRAGLAAAGHAYETGWTHSTLTPECEAFWSAGRQIGFGVAFKHQIEGGKTPFVFDRIDVRNEMRLYCQGDDTQWAYSLAVCYDTDRMRAYDTSFAIKRKLDCLEFGLSYRTRAQGLGVIFNLLPGETPPLAKDEE